LCKRDPRLLSTAPRLDRFVAPSPRWPRCCGEQRLGQTQERTASHCRSERRGGASMQLDLTKFTGRPPYDSQLVAAYQPLVGWRSRLTLGRLNAAPVAIPAFPKAVQVSVGENHAVTVSLNTGNRSFRILDDGSVPGLDAIDWLARDPRNIEFDTPDYLDGILVRAIQEDARGHLPDHPTSDDAFWSPYWRTS